MRACGSADNRVKQREPSPFTDELFRIAVHVCGVPVGATGLVDGIEHL
jgi:hypothetical protein